MTPASENHAEGVVTSDNSHSSLVTRLQYWLDNPSLLIGNPDRDGVNDDVEICLRLLSDPSKTEHPPTVRDLLRILRIHQT